MNYNFQIGGNIPQNESAVLSFGQYEIYNTNMASGGSGYLCFNADTGNFYIEPFVPNPPPVLRDPLNKNVSINYQKKIIGQPHF